MSHTYKSIARFALTKELCWFDLAGACWVATSQPDAHWTVQVLLFGIVFASSAMLRGLHGSWFTIPPGVIAITKDPVTGWFVATRDDEELGRATDMKGIVAIVSDKTKRRP